MRRDSENFEKSIKGIHLDILKIQSTLGAALKSENEQKGSKSDIQEGGKKQKESSTTNSQNNLQDYE